MLSLISSGSRSTRAAVGDLRSSTRSAPRMTISPSWMRTMRRVSGRIDGRSEETQVKSSAKPDHQARALLEGVEPVLVRLRR